MNVTPPGPTTGEPLKYTVPLVTWLIWNRYELPTGLFAADGVMKISGVPVSSAVAVVVDGAVPGSPTRIVGGSATGMTWITRDEPVVIGLVPPAGSVTWNVTCRSPAVAFPIER